MKRAAKTGLKIVVLAYVAAVAAFVVTALQRAEPLHKDELTASVQEELETLRQEALRDDPDHIRPRPVSKDDAAQVLGTVLEKKGTVINVNYTVIIQWLNFAILLLVLYGIFWDPLLKFLDERRNSISDEIKHAEALRKESENLLATRQEELARIKEARAGMIAQGKREGDKERERIVELAHIEATRIAREVKEKLEEEVRRARHDLQRDVAELATAIAQQMIQRELTTDDHQRLFDEMVKKLTAEVHTETSSEQDQE